MLRFIFVATAIFISQFYAHHLAFAESTPIEAVSVGSVNDNSTPLQDMLKKAKTNDKELVVGENIESFESMGLRVAKGFIYCLGALLLGLSFYKKFLAPAYTSSKSEAQITICSRTNIAPRMQLILVEVLGEKVLLAQTADSVSMLAKIEQQLSFKDELTEINNNELSKSFDLVRVAQGS